MDEDEDEPSDLSEVFDDDFAELPDALAGLQQDGCEWVSLNEVVPGCTVFSDVSPDDLHQGSLGDCWLISAMAALAEYPDVVEGLIHESDDHYVVNLYSFAQGAFTQVEINDKVPSNGNGPCFVRPTSNGEIWPCLIEKAFAKIGGGYKNIKGGWSLFAFGMMKGCTDLYKYTQKGSEGDYSITSVQFTCDNVKEGVHWNREGKQTQQDMWEELLEFNSQQYLMCAGSNSGSDSDSSGEGIVQGHAYSILDVVDGPVDTDYKLVKLRNPWGRKEWSGAWSDGSPEWDDNPDVQDKLGHEAGNDGEFWMPWADFQTQYSNIYVCKGRTGKRDMPAGAQEPSCDCSIM